MTQTKQKAPRFIAPGEQAAAAIYLTLSNLAMEYRIERSGGELKSAYNQADNDLAMECGQGAAEELNDWTKNIIAGDPYCFTAWEEAKAKRQMKYFGEAMVPAAPETDSLTLNTQTMATNATRTKKQAQGANAPQLKDGWKPMPGFGRYAFYKNGKVVNRSTGTELAASGQKKGEPAYQLTDDKGKRSPVTPAEVKALFKEEKPAAAPVKATAAKKEGTGSRGVAKLNYETAMDIRRRLAKGENRSAIAKEYGVDPWTIQSIAINYSYRVQDGDTNPVPAAMMEQFTGGNLPKAWKGKSRNEIRELAGYKLA